MQACIPGKNSRIALSFHLFALSIVKQFHCQTDLAEPLETQSVLISAPAGILHSRVRMRPFGKSIQRQDCSAWP